MRIRPAAALTVLLLVLAVAPAAPAQTPEGMSYSSDNLEHITNLQLEERHDLGSSLRLATDVDFLSFTAPGDFAPPEGLDAALAPSPGQTRELALVGTQVNGLQVVDVTEPTEPALVAVYECAIAQGDVFIWEREDLGRTFAAYTSDIISGQTNWSSRCHAENEAHGAFPGTYGTFIIDITNPYEPESVSFIHLERGTHQVAVHPDGQWLYSAPSNREPDRQRGSVGQIDIVDVSDTAQPGEPVAVPFLTGFDGHDLSFSDDGSRAYVAAISHTVILDTSAAGAPTVVGFVSDPTIDTHHDAYTYDLAVEGLGERTFLFVTDELLGAAGNGFCPGGGLHVFDITGELELAPVKVGAFFAPEVTVQEGGRGGVGGLVRCTAHVPQIHHEQQLMTIAWFGAGVRVLDLSGLAGVTAGVTPDTAVTAGEGIREIGFFRFPDSDVWAAKTNEIAADGSFYLYGIDTVRHFDVFRFSPDGSTQSEDVGRWLDPQQTLRAAQALGTGARSGDSACLLPPSGDSA